MSCKYLLPILVLKNSFRNSGSQASQAIEPISRGDRRRSDGQIQFASSLAAAARSRRSDSALLQSTAMGFRSSSIEWDELSYVQQRSSDGQTASTSSSANDTGVDIQKRGLSRLSYVVGILAALLLVIVFKPNQETVERSRSMAFAPNVSAEFYQEFFSKLRSDADSQKLTPKEVITIP